MADRVLVLMQWNPASETVTLACGGKSFEFDALTSLQMRRKIWPYTRELGGDGEGRVLREAANVVIAPLPEEAEG